MNEYNRKELKQCPFCGGNPSIREFLMRHVLVKDKDAIEIHCQRCGASTRSFECSVNYSARQLAINAWNNRISEEQKGEIK